MSTPRLHRMKTTERLKDAYLDCQSDEQSEHILRQLQVMERIVALGGYD